MEAPEDVGEDDCGKEDEAGAGNVGSKTEFASTNLVELSETSSLNHWVRIHQQVASWVSPSK